MQDVWYFCPGSARRGGQEPARLTPLCWDKVFGDRLGGPGQFIRCFPGVKGVAVFLRLAWSGVGHPATEVFIKRSDLGCLQPGIGAPAVLPVD